MPDDGRMASKELDALGEAPGARDDLEALTAMEWALRQSLNDLLEALSILIQAEEQPQERPLQA